MVLEVEMDYHGPTRPYWQGSKTALYEMLESKVALESNKALAIWNVIIWSCCDWRARAVVSEQESELVFCSFEISKVNCAAIVWVFRGRYISGCHGGGEGETLREQ